MEKIGIVTESTVDLPLETIEKNRIAIVPVKLDWPDLEALSGENTFQKMREAERLGVKSFGRTSQPSPKDYLDQYKIQLARFDRILCLSLSSKLSGSYNSAILAKNFLGPEDQARIFNFDSLTISAGQGLAVLKALELIEAKKEIGEITAELKSSVGRTSFFIILENYKWLEASGRISKLTAIILRRMAASGLRPLLSLKNGKLSPAGLKSNARDFPAVLFSQLKKTAEKEKISGRKIKMGIIHGDDPAAAEKLGEMVKKEFENAEIVFSEIADDVIGVVTGPNALAIAWLAEGSGGLEN